MNTERSGLGAGLAFGSLSGANKNIHKYPPGKSAYGRGRSVCVCLCARAGWGKLPGAGGSKKTKKRR